MTFAERICVWWLAALGLAFLLVMVGIAGGALDRMLRRQAHRRMVETWRRTRVRAPLKTMFYSIGCDGQVIVTPIFGYPSAAIPLEFDPITKERVQFGWSESELREAERRPAEFYT